MTSTLRARWLPILKTVWRRLTEPAASLHDPQERRNARLLSALLALSIAILLFGRVFRSITQVSESSFAVITIWLNIFILVGVYGLSRTRRYQFGTAIAVIGVSIIVYFQSIYRGYTEENGIINPSTWVIALMLISSFVVSWRLTLALGVAYMTGLLMMPRFLPEVSFYEVRASIELIFALSLVIALAAYLRQRDWQMIQTQTEDLMDSEDRYRMLFAAAFEGIVIHDDGTVVDVNDALQTMLGYSRDEMIGASVLAYIPPEWREAIFEKARANIMTYELPGLRKDGTTFPMEVSVKRVMYKGKLLRVVAMRDIAERKREEAERIHLITEHERGQVLRQPLATMQTSLYLLRRKSGELGDAARQVDTLDAQVAHLTRLLEDLFAMSRLDEPALFMQHAPLDLNQLVLRIVQEQLPIALHKGHRLHLEQAGLPPVLADNVELKRALTHILVNALSYTHDGGQITVRTALQDRTAVVEVEDNGIGISPEDLPHIFERFYRADLARQTETGASGLGLAIAQKIIENHSGNIGVESTPGVGSTFRVYLPLPSQNHTG